MELIFAVHKLATVLAKYGKVHFEVLVYLLRYIKDNNTLVLKYYEDMNDAHLYDLLRQASIKTENHLIYFLILVGKIFQTLAEVQEHKLSFIKVVQLTMAQMFQDQLISLVQKVSTIQHAL